MTKYSPEDILRLRVQLSQLQGPHPKMWSDIITFSKDIENPNGLAATCKRLEEDFLQYMEDPEVAKKIQQDAYDLCVSFLRHMDTELAGKPHPISIAFAMYMFMMNFSASLINSADSTFWAGFAFQHAKDCANSAKQAAYMEFMHAMGLKPNPKDISDLLGRAP